jgi:transcriptional regulator with XRE-family HTH domain
MGDCEAKFRPTSIGDLLEAHGLTQAGFAKRAGVSRQLVGAWASGWIQPKFDTVLRMCVEFGVDPAFFAQGLPAKGKKRKR